MDVANLEGEVEQGKTSNILGTGFYELSVICNLLTNSSSLTHSTQFRLTHMLIFTAKWLSEAVCFQYRAVCISDIWSGELT